MRCELPQFRRCCFCLPLRFGLIGWGYFKLIIDAWAIIQASFSIMEAYWHSISASDEYRRAVYVEDIIILSIVLFIFAMDFCLTSVYVIGGHMKNVKLLRVYYYYTIVLWVLMVLLAAVLIGFRVNSTLQYPSVRRWMWIVLDLAFIFAIIAVHFYILLLLKSEIVKLDSNCEFRFVNNAARAECSLTSKDDVTNGEIEAA